MPAVGLDREVEVGPAEVVTLEEERLAMSVRERSGEAVADVELGRTRRRDGERRRVRRATMTR
jgi:hypothetical protein